MASGGRLARQDAYQSKPNMRTEDTKKKTATYLRAELFSRIAFCSCTLPRSTLTVCSTAYRRKQVTHSMDPYTHAQRPPAATVKACRVVRNLQLEIDALYYTTLVTEVGGTIVPD